LLLLTVGAAFAIEATIVLTIGPTNRSFPSFFRGNRTVLGVSLTHHQIFIIILGIIVVSLLWVMIHKTKFGIAIRAVSQDREVASMHAIEPRKISIYVMILATALSTIGGLILVPLQSAVPTMGWTIMVSAFTVTILGGIGDIRGVLVASAIVAYSEILTAFTIAPMMKEVATFGIMILTLLIRPKGLFGK
jgi:branched-subunit amino acid ABC-type transport system permease component